ncbi:cupin domain-containing protein [uncultured Arcticibacterium sp.]|uniref:cupin domain-containing protein n=1 Tax=uncultured Arcticibacterium sp. TaxID=2173042 RepID=UPI0030F936B2
MKKRVLFSFVLLALFASQGIAQVASKAYSFDNTPAEGSGNLLVKTFFDGSTRDFSRMSMKALISKKNLNHAISDAAMETLVIVKSGEIDFTLHGETKTMGAGSIALLMPQDALRLKAKRESSFYVMTYQSRDGKYQNAGKSALQDWDDVPYKTHDKGGIRKFYDRTTAHCKRMEMHVTNLNPGIKSHEPHTHRAAEIILLTTGKSEMELGNGIVKAQKGDFYYVESEVPHGIKNIDSEQIQYFAYQFE